MLGRLVLKVTNFIGQAEAFPLPPLFSRSALPKFCDPPVLLPGESSAEPWKSSLSDSEICWPLSTTASTAWRQHAWRLDRKTDPPGRPHHLSALEIGRASCRERGEV